MFICHVLNVFVAARGDFPLLQGFHEGLGSGREWHDEIDLSRHKKLCEESERFDRLPGKL
jgi:hypothetical protein